MNSKKSERFRCQCCSQDNACANLHVQASLFWACSNEMQSLRCGLVKPHISLGRAHVSKRRPNVIGFRSYCVVQF